MSADIINLREARKQKEREDRLKQAARNREKFGRTKQERAVTDAERERNRKIVESAYRPSADDDIDPGSAS